MIASSWAGLMTFFATSASRTAFSFARARSSVAAMVVVSGGVDRELAGGGQRDPAAAVAATARRPIAIDRGGDELAQHAEPAVAEEHEVELAVVHEGAGRDLEAPAVPRSVADDGLQDALPARAAVDLDLHANASAPHDRGEGRERERALAALDRPTCAERVGVEAHAGGFEEDL